MVPLITVLIPTFNRAHFLSQCLDSVLSQTIQPFQIIVIDDGSTDNTKDILKSYVGKIQYISKPNGGKSSALNFGLDQVRGDYVWVMDDDNIALPLALERLVEPLEKHAEFGMSFSNYLLTGTLTDGTVDVDNAKETPFPTFPDDQLFLALLQHGCFIGGGALLVRTSVYQAVGPHDQTLLRSQDFDMALRLSLICRGVRVTYPTFYYRTHEGIRGTAAEPFLPGDITKKWNLYDIRIMLKLLSQSDAMSKTVRRRLHQHLAEKQFAVAYDHFEHNELTEARQYLLNSLKNHWLKPSRISYLAATFFPKWVISSIRKVKRISRFAL